MTTLICLALITCLSALAWGVYLLWPRSNELRDLRQLHGLVLTERHLKQLFLADILESAEPWKRAELRRDAFAEQLAKRDGSFVSRAELVAMRRAMHPDQYEAATTDTHSDVTRVA